MCAPARGAAMYFRRKTSAGRAYLQIVESRRDGDQVRQQVIATLGRFEELQASGQLERLLRSGCQRAAESPHFWAFKIPQFGGGGDQPLARSTPPFLGGRPRRLGCGASGGGWIRA